MIGFHKNTVLQTGTDVPQMQQNEFPSPEQFSKMSESNQKAIIAAIQESIKRLEEENKHLRQENDMLKDKLYGSF